MSRSAVISLLLCLQVNYSFAGPILTPQQFDNNLGGLDFCSRGNSEHFESICSNAATAMGYSNCDQSQFQGLSCQQQTVYLKEGGRHGGWHSRYPNLLGCVIKRPNRNTRTVYLGEGFKQNDVFAYGMNDQGNIVAEGNYKGVLKGIF